MPESNRWQIPRISSIALKRRYWASYALNGPIEQVLDSLARNKQSAASIHLDTAEDMKNIAAFEGKDHHQGIARTAMFPNGNVYCFLTHSEVDHGDQGSLGVFEYSGPLDGDHFQATKPTPVAPRKVDLKLLRERHPSDLCFLPEINGHLSGYLFVAHEFEDKAVVVYRWIGEPASLTYVGALKLPKDVPGGPQFVFLDNISDHYVLGVTSGQLCWTFTAPQEQLFPSDAPGTIALESFGTAQGPTPFHVHPHTSQVKLVRDANAVWFLLVFWGDKKGKTNSADHVSAHPISLDDKKVVTVGSEWKKVHLLFPGGDTSFVSTGTHLVERSGRLLVSTTYRWSKNEGGDAGYVSRLDELASD